MPFNPKIMANYQFSGVNDTDSRIFSFHLVEETTQSLQTTGHDFNKSVVAKQFSKSRFPEWNDHLAIKIFEESKTGLMK
ncbi:hypothetical protein AAU60_04555 [Acinetobacter johnsonii]|nr:hypothetical protein AAU60_09780 [Acinetobacter johnsonii]KUG39497.1 hypothetical protein AAU60_04555 [Acinetobacter johnsonii]